MANAAAIYCSRKRPSGFLSRRLRRADEVYDISSYFYLVSRDDSKVATVQLNVATAHLNHHKVKPMLGQFRGPCNATVSQELMQALRKWLREAMDIQMPEYEMPERDDWTPTLVDNRTAPAFDEGQEIPF